MKKILIFSIFILPFVIAFGIQEKRRGDNTVKVRWENDKGKSGECIITNPNPDDYQGDCSNIPLQYGENIVTIKMIDEKGQVKSGTFLITYDKNGKSNMIQFKQEKKF